MSNTTVIGVFRSDANHGGITVRNAVIRTAPLVATSGLVGDKNNEFENKLKINNNFDLRPKGIVQMLDLLRPIYRKTAAYGHFGRDEDSFSW